jgi:hypothetical protein
LRTRSNAPSSRCAFERPAAVAKDQSFRSVLTGDSVFATVTVRTKGALSQKTVKLMVFKLVQAASKTWRRLKGANQLPRLIEGVTFRDGVAKADTENRAA